MRNRSYAIARLEQEEDDPLAQNVNPRDRDPLQNAGLFMEWAVGKQGEIMRPNSGKLERLT